MDSITLTSRITVLSICLSPFVAVTEIDILNALWVTSSFSGGIIPSFTVWFSRGSSWVTGLAKPTVHPSGGSEYDHSKSATELPSLLIVI